MKADTITKIIKNIEHLSYKAILFDGVWGIGKTYAITDALKEYDNVCNISMFGLNDAKQIYHEALFQLALKNGKGGKVGEIASNVLEGLSKISERIEKVKNIIQSFTEERELFLLMSKEFNTIHFIVIDDLERMSANLNIEEVFGIIEELKQCNYVKVIIISNTAEINSQNKMVFDKYNEKVIDRIYHVTEMSQKVEWGKLNIHAGFIMEFLDLHKVKNLRTLIKAQNFYDDVKLYCQNIEDVYFFNEIRLICYAIVVESTDNIYFKKINEKDTNHTKRLADELSNHLDHRIRRYLSGINSSSNLVDIILKYYQNNLSINIDALNAEYKVYLQSGSKPNYYKTDKEIRNILPSLEELMNHAQNLGELNKFADEYIVWSDIIKDENNIIIQEYKNKLQKMLKKIALDGKEQILNYSSDLFHLSSEKIKKIYKKEIENMRVFVIKTYIEYLQKHTNGDQAFEYSYKLRNYFENTLYRNIIKENASGLYNRNSFPINVMNDRHYHTCYNIMYVLYHINEEKFLRYCDELKQNCDNMSAHRIQILTEEIIKN